MVLCFLPLGSGAEKSPKRGIKAVGRLSHIASNVLPAGDCSAIAVTRIDGPSLGTAIWWGLVLRSEVLRIWLG